MTRFGSTQRRDAWWIENLPFIIVFGGFPVYTTWRAFENNYYWADPYLSPFYSPLIDPRTSLVAIFARAPDSRRAARISHHLLLLSQSLLPRVFPRSARHAPWARERQRKYRGETTFPFILQNIHRYFFYIARDFLGFLWYDAMRAFFFPTDFGIGVGTLVMLVNIILLTIYTFSCHSLRHLVGGKLDCFSCATLGSPRESAWRGVTKLNEHHMFWAWVSMISVGLTDLYIRLVASGALKDIRIL